MNTILLLRKVIMEDYEMHITSDELKTLWMPFTNNKHFKRSPKMLTSASGMYYYDNTGLQLLDATAGHACVNAGHKRQEIINAMHQQANTLDYSPAFKFGNQVLFAMQIYYQK